MHVRKEPVSRRVKQGHREVQVIAIAGNHPATKTNSADFEEVLLVWFCLDIYFYF